jgi:hypothetical protein
VSQSESCAHSVGQSAAAVQKGRWKSVQHFGVPPEQSVSWLQDFSHTAAFAHTWSLAAGLSWQHVSPIELSQLELDEQKCGHAAASTHALPPPLPKSQQISPIAVLQSLSAPQSFGHAAAQSPCPFGPGPPAAQAKTAVTTVTANAMAVALVKVIM